MFLIGIISGKDYIKIEEELYKILDKKEYNLITINNETISNFKHIKLDAILIANGTEILKENKEILKNIINNSKYLVINTDIENDIKLLENTKSNVITYGFNSKTTITASSIKQDYILVCLQRNIKSINNKIIEQQEKKIDINGKCNIDYMLGIIGILTIFEKN